MLHSDLVTISSCGTDLSAIQRLSVASMIGRETCFLGSKGVHALAWILMHSDLESFHMLEEETFSI